MVGSTPAFESCDKISAGDCMAYVETDSTDAFWVANTIVVVALFVDKEGIDILTEVTGTESVLEVTGIMTPGIVYYSLDENYTEQ
jgi:hypothetical protein